MELQNGEEGWDASRRSWRGKERGPSEKHSKERGEGIEATGGKAGPFVGKGTGFEIIPGKPDLGECRETS